MIKLIGITIQIIAISTIAKAVLESSISLISIGSAFWAFSYFLLHDLKERDLTAEKLR